MKVKCPRVKNICLFQCRSRMLDLKCNFKNYNLIHLKCSACGLIDENQMHLMQCPMLNQNNIEEAHQTKYIDIFSEDIMQMKAAGKILKTKMTTMFDKYK